jgi:hypothetical protein
VETDYLLDSEVFFFQSCLYPMKTLYPRRMYTLPRGGMHMGIIPSVGSGGSKGKWGFEGEAPEGKTSL